MAFTAIIMDRGTPRKSIVCACCDETSALPPPAPTATAAYGDGRRMDGLGCFGGCGLPTPLWWLLLFHAES